MSAPFLEVVSLSRDDASEWAYPHACYAIDYVGQADPKKHRFGAKVYRVWIERPTPDLRQQCQGKETP